jgi:hypothetical protein
MSVNPNLDTLMRVIEDQQDKMPEGEYLAAMNALGALHRVVPAPPVPPIPSGQAAAYAPGGGALFGGAGAGAGAGGANPNSYSNLIALMGQYGYNTWTRVTRLIPEHRQMTAQEWVALTQDEQNVLNCEATHALVKVHERTYRNPEPSACSFIARHAVGPWSYGCEHSTWTCVCGYQGKSKNWKKHEESERHTDWAQHRIVPKRTIEMMKKRIADDERGEVIRFNQPLTGGIRYFPVTQDRNEWTHPELYDAGVHRTRNGNGGWFVHHRDDWAHHWV